VAPGTSMLFAVLSSPVDVALVTLDNSSTNYIQLSLLVGAFNPFEKILVTWDHFPMVLGEKERKFETETTSSFFWF